MKTNHPLVLIGAMSLAALLACQKASSSSPSLLNDDPSSQPQPDPGGVTGAPGTDLPGLGSASAPTADGVIGRIQNALVGANPLAGNFAKAIAQVKPNLPQVANPLQAVGLDQIPLLVYAACSDVKMSAYNVPNTGAISDNAAALVSEGMTILNTALGGLATDAPQSSQLQAKIQSLVDALAADKKSDGTAAQTMKTSFVSVCMAATTAGVGMVGF
jgi:hypothetical protein